MNAPLLGDGRYLLVVRREDASLLFALGMRLVPFQLNEARWTRDS